MAATKQEVLISKLTDQLGTPFQRQNLYFADIDITCQPKLQPSSCEQTNTGCHWKTSPCRGLVGLHRKNLRPTEQPVSAHFVECLRAFELNNDKQPRGRLTFSCFNNHILLQQRTQPMVINVILFLNSVLIFVKLFLSDFTVVLVFINIIRSYAHTSVCISCVDKHSRLYVTVQPEVLRGRGFLALIYAALKIN
jgi:hypothetical protein